MAGKIPADRLKLSTFKLDALLAITQAINENLPVKELMRRYESLLRDDLKIGKIVVFKYQQSWQCIAKSGVQDDEFTHIDVDEHLILFDEITFVNNFEENELSAFDIIIPVYINNQPKSFVLIGDIDEEGEGVSPTIKHLNFIQTLSNIIIVAIENIRLFQQSLHQEALRKELELASKMQSMLIPTKRMLPHNEHVSFTAFYHPHLEVGGDYYDYIDLGDKDFGFCIADVSGKGISAALLMSNFQANLHALFTEENSLENIVKKLNERVLKSAKGEKFITLFIARYNYSRKTLEYINAGHNPPLIYEIKSKRLSYLKDGCVGIGMLDEIPSVKAGSFSILETTKLLCYTDGLVELLDEHDVEFGTKKIEKNVRNESSIGHDIRDIIEEHQILTGNNAIFDDISILGIEFY